MSSKFEKHLETGEKIVAGPFVRLGSFRTVINLLIFIGAMALMIGLFFTQVVPTLSEMGNVSPDSPGSWGKFTPYAPYVICAIAGLMVLVFAFSLIFSLREKLLLTDRAVLMIGGRKAKRVLLKDIDQIQIEGWSYRGLITAIFKNIFYGRFYLTFHTVQDGKEVKAYYPQVISGSAGLLFGKGNARKAVAEIEVAVEKAKA